MSGPKFTFFLGRRKFTIEKWYTECGSKHPIQSGPSCDVEKAMYATFNQVKAINPNITNIMVRSMCVSRSYAF